MHGKVEYIFDNPEPLAPRARLTFVPVDSEERRAMFDEAVRAILEGSLDGSDRAAVQQGQEQLQAQRLSRPDAGFVYRTDWWSLAFGTKQEDLVGVIQPVVFAGCDRDGLHEGTIHYIGVLPRHRGHGYVDDLLAEATNRLARLGVWRICTDTDVNNHPMRRAFLRLGYREGRTRAIPFPQAKP